MGRDPASIQLGLMGAAALTRDGLEQAAESLVTLRESGVAVTIVGIDARLDDYGETLQEFGERFLADARG